MTDQYKEHTNFVRYFWNFMAASVAIYIGSFSYLFSTTGFSDLTAYLIPPAITVIYFSYVYLWNRNMLFSATEMWIIEQRLIRSLGTELFSFVSWRERIINSNLKIQIDSKKVKFKNSIDYYSDKNNKFYKSSSINIKFFEILDLDNKNNTIYGTEQRITIISSIIVLFGNILCIYSFANSKIDENSKYSSEQNIINIIHKSINNNLFEVVIIACLLLIIYLLHGLRRYYNLRGSLQKESISRLKTYDDLDRKFLTKKY